MEKFLVVSYNPDEQQWHYDVVFAKDAAAAKERIASLRDYCVDFDAFDMATLERMTRHVREETIEQSEKWLAELSAERDSYEDSKEK